MRRNEGWRRNRGDAEERIYLSIFRTDVRQRVILCATARSIHVGDAEYSGNRQRSHENSLAFSSEDCHPLSSLQPRLSTVNRSLIHVVRFLLKSRKKGVTSVAETVDVTCHTEKFAEDENQIDRFREDVQLSVALLSRSEFAHK